MLILKVFIMVVAIAYLAIAPTFLFNKALYQVNLLNNSAESETAILNLWHIETFEGGSFSRKSFLENLAIKFNKTHTNTFVMIKCLNLQQAILNIGENNYPDIVSYGVGAGATFLPYMMPLSAPQGVRSDLLKYGIYQSNQLAVPYMLGGYCVISKSNLLKQNFDNPSEILNDLFNFNVITKNKTIFSVGCGGNSYLNFYEVLNQNNIKGNVGGFFKNDMSTYEVYQKFLESEIVSLIGTTRDVARCKLREQNGTLSNCYYNFLGGYSDLTQYFSVLSKDKLKSSLAQSYISLALQEDSQKEIEKLGLFSVLNTSIYFSGFMQNFERVLQKPLIFANPFFSEQQIDAEIDKSFNKLFYGEV